jgi:hypothetical protein
MIVEARVEERRLVVPEDAVAARVPNQNLDVEFGDEELMSKGDGFDKIGPPKKEVVRVALLTDVVSPKKDWIHFVTNKGAIRCMSERDIKGNITVIGPCCKKLNLDERQAAQLSIVVLAFLYKNASPIDGKYPATPPPIDWELGWVKLSRSGYRRVSKLIQEDQKAHDFDMLISWKDGDGIGYEYNVIASRCRFRQNPELVAEVMEAAEAFRDGVKLTKKLGRLVTEAEFLAMLGGTKGASSAADANVDDVSKL